MGGDANRRPFTVDSRQTLEVEDHGLLVCAPRHDVLMAHVISNSGVLDAAAGMLSAASAMYESGPGSLSPNLYWYRNGGLTRLPYEEADGAFKFNPPGDFADLLHALSALSHLS